MSLWPLAREIWPCSRGHVRSHFCKFDIASKAQLWPEHFETCSVQYGYMTLQIAYLGLSYHWPQVRSISWPALYKSMREKSSTSNTYQIASNRSEWWWMWLRMTSPVQFCISNPLIGQRRSNDDFIRPIYVSPITFDWNEIETWGRCQSVRLVKTHLLICNLTYLGQSVTLTLADLRSSYQMTFWVTKYMSRSALTKERRWRKISALSQIAKKLLTKNLTKLTSRKTEHFLFNLTWKVYGWPKWVHSHTMDSERHKLFAGLCREALSHSGARWRGGGTPPPPPLGAFSFDEKGGASEG